MAEGKILKKDETEFSEILEEFKTKLGEEVGAIGSFIGIVREDAKKEGKVKQLHYESAENADKELKTIARGIEKNTKGISEIAIYHIVDDLEPKDEIIYVLVGGNHREEVFEVLPSIMDQVKKEVRIWKKEITTDEDYWINEE